MSASKQKKTIPKEVQPILVFFFTSVFLSYFLNQNIAFSISAASVFTYFSYVPEMMGEGTKVSLCNKLLKYMLPAGMLLLACLVMHPAGMLITVAALAGLTVSAKRSGKPGYYVGMLACPLLCFLVLESGLGSSLAMLNTFKEVLINHNAEYLPYYGRYLLSVIFLYALLNITVAAFKERKKAFLVFGAVSVIISIVSVMAIQVAGQPLSISQLPEIIRIIGAVPDWTVFLNVQFFLNERTIPIFVFLLSYFVLSNHLAEDGGLLRKKDRLIRLVIGLGLVIALLVYMAITPIA